MSDVESKITKSVSYQFANLVISSLVGVFFIPFIINSLGKEQYGIFEIVYSLNIINAVLDIGIGSTIVNYSKKYFQKSRDEFSNFFWTYFWFKIILSLLGFITCLFLAANSELVFSNINPSDLAYLRYSIIWFAVGVLIQNITSFFDAIQNGFVRFDMTAFANIISKLFYIIAFFVWLYLIDNNNIIGFCLITFVLVPISKLAVQIMQVFIYLPDLITKPKWIKLGYLQETWSYLSGISFITISAQVFSNGIQAILALLAGPVIVAEFGILRRILGLIKKVSSMLIRPVLPAAQDLRKKYSLKEIIIKGTRFHSIVVFGLTVLILINAEVISIYFLNSEFLNFRIHLFIFALQMLMPSFAVMLMLYYNEGKSKMSVQFNICNTLLSITLAYFGLKYLGLKGFLGGLTLGYAICILVQFGRFTYYFNMGNIIFFKIYLKRYTTTIFCLMTYGIITYLIGYNLWGVVLWNLIIGMILAIVAWIDISKSLRKQIMKKIL